MARNIRTPWVLEKEAMLGRLARRSKSPLEFIHSILHFVLKEAKAKAGILYLADKNAPSLSALKNLHLEMQSQIELVATAIHGIFDESEIPQHIFLTSKSVLRGAVEVSKNVSDLGFERMEVIPLFCDNETISGLIILYSHRDLPEIDVVKSKLKPVLAEASIMLDFVVDRFLQRELSSLNRFGLAAVNFDTNDGMSRMVDETRKSLGCEGLSFFVKDTSTSNGMFWLTASSPKPIPATPVGYSESDNNITGRVLLHKTATIIHNVDEVRKRVQGINKSKWCELLPGKKDRSVLFVPVVKGGNTVALLRCTNKELTEGPQLFNKLDTRRAQGYAEVLHTWQSAIENEVRLTSSLLDVAHELGTSAAGIKSRAELVDISLNSHNPDKDKMGKVLGDIMLSIDAVLEMMDFLTDFQTQPETLVNRPAIQPFKPYADLCVPVVNAFREQAKERGITFRFVGEHNIGTIYCDAKPFIQIMQNIVGNAVKYTKQNREIIIYLEAAVPMSRYVALRVISESLYIRPDEREYIFRFRYRAESTKGVPATGQGRGLAIARARARRFKGDIVHSYVEHMNAFSLLLPRTLLRPESN